MDQKDMWQDMRRHLSEMAETIDGALRKVPPFSFVRGGRPPVDVYDAGDAIVVRADVPGVPRDLLEVMLKGLTLTIEGREDRTPYEGYACLTGERGGAEFCRQIPLPDSVDPEQDPAASLSDGVLTVRLAKRPSAAGRTIPVERPPEEQ
jgi:HSP20 family protein